MKKSLFALAAVGALAGVAHAQSSVTVYGIIDEGISGGNTNYAPGGAGTVIKTTGLSVQPGNQSTSRLGFKGNEDLGGGLSAFFTYEIKMDNDSSGLFSSARQAFVGVKKNGWGSMSAGLQNTPIYDAVLQSDPGSVNNIAGNLITTLNKGNQGQLPNQDGVANNTPYSTRLSNTVALKTDNFSGFTARALVQAISANSTQTANSVGGPGLVTTAGTAPAATQQNNTGAGIGLDYTWKNLFLTANYQAFKATSAANGLNTTPVVGVGGSLGGVTGGANLNVNANDTNQYYAATYDFGILKAYAQYITRTVANNVDTSFFWKYSAEQIGVNSYVTPAIQVWASAAMGKSNAYASGTLTTASYNPAQANLNAFQLGSNYWLSKRTNLYAIYGQTATSNFTYTSATANPTSGNQNNYAVGVRHTF